MGYHILVYRDSFTETSTVARMFVNGDLFGQTLEDVSRGEGIKLDTKTCIPPGTYLVDVTMSSRFKRLMPIIYNQPNGYEIIKDGKSWKGCRFHGGNDHTHSAGCPLVAKNRLNPDLIQGSLEKELTELLIKLGSKGFVTFVNWI